jgi:hypothetical protein
MSDPQQIERDLRDYLEKEPNLNKTDRLTYLQTIFHKHLEVGKLEHLVTGQDLFVMFSEAKQRYSKTKFPVTVSKKQLDYPEGVHMVVLEAFIGYLNRMKLLKKLIRFDYRD